MTDLTTRPPMRSLLDAIVAGNRGDRSKNAFTADEVAEHLGEHAGLPVENGLRHLLCGNLLFMRHAKREGRPGYVWTYMPSAGARRLLKETAEQGGPTEEQIETAITAFRLGNGRGGGAS